MSRAVRAWQLFCFSPVEEIRFTTEPRQPPIQLYALGVPAAPRLGDGSSCRFSVTSAGSDGWQH